MRYFRVTGAAWKTHRRLKKARRWDEATKIWKRPDAWRNVWWCIASLCRYRVKDESTPRVCPGDGNFAMRETNFANATWKYNAIYGTSGAKRAATSTRAHSNFTRMYFACVTKRRWYSDMRRWVYTVISVVSRRCIMQPTQWIVLSRGSSFINPWIAVLFGFRALAFPQLLEYCR